MNGTLIRWVSATAGLARTYLARRRALRASRYIDELPPRLRKDIGWPDPERWSDIGDGRARF